MNRFVVIGTDYHIPSLVPKGFMSQDDHIAGLKNIRNVVAVRDILPSIGGRRFIVCLDASRLCRCRAKKAQNFKGGHFTPRCGVFDLETCLIRRLDVDGRKTTSLHQICQLSASGSSFFFAVQRMQSLLLSEAKERKPSTKENRVKRWGVFCPLIM